jgi:DNA-binding transcriptional ArsR family regulator
MLRDYETVLKAAGDPSRARILKLLGKGELCVCQIVAVLELSQSTVSKHLSLLRAADLIEERKAGRWIYLRLAQAPGNSYAAGLLSLLPDWLKSDKAIAADTKRLAQVKKMAVEAICDRYYPKQSCCGRKRREGKACD